MKSDVVLIKKGQNSIDLILNEVERVVKYTSLDGKKAMHLRLLAEELNNMLPELSKWYEGKFYIEANENEYILHANFNSFDMNIEEREALLSVSKSGKNAAAVGICGKIRSIVEEMALLANNNNNIIPDLGQPAIAGAFRFDFCADYSYTWNLNNYKQAPDEGNGWDELEKSIVANIADDVIVGVKGNSVEISVVKKF